MRRKYLLQSEALGCYITIEYADGMLCGLEAELPSFNTVQKGASKYGLYFNEAVFLEEAKKNKVAITEIKRDITFDLFWDKYNDKARSGKQEAVQVWNKLTQKEQLEAFDFITTYFNTVKLNNVAKLYAASYLNKKRWIK